MNGYELCKMVKHNYPEIYFIMVTGNKDIDLIKKSFDAGAIDFIGKTCSKIELLARIKNILRIKNAESKLQSLMDKLLIKNDSLILGKSADNDNLTGLVNRETIFKRYSLKIYEATEKSEDFSVILLDINRFSRINEEYGFLKGDEILITVSHMIKQNIPKNSIVGRFGGDQFIILIPNFSKTEAYTTTEKLFRKVKSLSFKTMLDLNITLCAGLCSLQKHKENDLISIAYKHLNKAKSSNQNSIEVEE